MADHPLATHEEHPLPASLMHWTHLLSIVVLTFTGFYIHWPFFSGAMGVMRNLHFVFAFILVAVLVIRVYWAFFGAGSAPVGSHTKVRDYKFFGPQKENRGTFWGTLRYYLFLQKEAPSVSKYNGLQKGTYVFWGFLVIAQAITGFELWSPTAPALLPLTYALGGVLMVRMYHYLIMWVFIVTTLLHVYLALMHWDEFMMMFFQHETKQQSAQAGTAAPQPERTP